MNAEAEKVIAALALAPLLHEGGWFRQVWQSPQTFRPGRAACSSIYFLVTPEDFSALHRLQTEEIWLFHAGDPLEHVWLDASDGSTHVTRLGCDVLAGEVPQLVVPAGAWQGARSSTANATVAVRGWTLLGCIMAPAWDELEFELGSRESLLRAFPAQAALVRSLTRNQD